MQTFVIADATFFQSRLRVLHHARNFSELLGMEIKQRRGSRFFGCLCGQECLLHGKRVIRKLPRSVRATDRRVAIHSVPLAETARFSSACRFRVCRFSAGILDVARLHRIVRAPGMRLRALHVIRYFADHFAIGFALAPPA